MAKQPSARPAGQGLHGIDHGECVARFLGAIQLLRGCDYSDDRRIVRADLLVREFAAAHVLGTEPAKLSTKDAADVLYLLHNVEPIAGETILDGGKTHVGHSEILSWVEHSLLNTRKRGTSHG